MYYVCVPSRNIYKVDVPHSFYHVYARGVSQQKIFLETRDYTHFLKLFERYLSIKPKISTMGVTYPRYRDKVELTCYCLMNNHFHLLVYQIEQTAMKKLMQSVMTSYSRYFNLKYNRSGPLFESRYKASRIDQDSYLQHITRYIHLNPRLWQTHRASSLKHYLGVPSPEWLQTAKVTGLFKDITDYQTFVSDYEEHKQMLDELKHELADQ